MQKIQDRLKRINDNIANACVKAARDPSEVKLVVVTKAAQLEAVKEVIRLGYNDLGENRVQHLKKVHAEIQDFLERNPKLDQQVNWHMIGHLQRNKVRQVLPLTCMVHSLDTLRLAEEINTAAAKLGVKAKVLLQVNTSQEPQKYGMPVGAVIHLAEQMMSLKNIEICGLMTMAAFTNDTGVVRSCFTRAKELFEELKGEGIVTSAFKELSMGMSNDYTVAVEEGATILRVGSAIFAD